jgi:RNA polymerase sigma-70 factor (ECF subfamily)
LQGSPAQTSGGAQVSTSDNREGLDVERIIRTFTAKETEFRQALNGYAFRRDAVIQTIGMGGQITGEYHRTSQFVFAGGERFEKITYFPQPTLTEISFTQEDLEDLGGVQPFALEASKINLYNFTYAGKERLDELDTYIFDVQPKVVPKKVSERFFQGRIWVDEKDLQIVKVRGKGVPEGKQRFPTFETYREQIDGKFWFPTYTFADDELVFPKGQTVHLRMRMTNNVAEAEDLTQEVFVHLFRKIGSFRGESAFTTWLHQLTVNHVLMYFRKRKKREQTTDDGEMPNQIVKGTEHPARMQVLDKITLDNALSQLAPGYRAVFILHDIEGYEHEEIGNILGCSTGTSKSQLHKARLKLRKLLNAPTPVKSI